MLIVHSLWTLPLQATVLDVSPFFTEVVLLHVPSQTLFVADSIWRVRLCLAHSALIIFILIVGSSCTIGENKKGIIK